MSKLWIAFKDDANLKRIYPGLRDGIALVGESACGHQGKSVAVERVNRFQLPVLHLQDHQAAPGVEDDEIRLAVFQPDGYVVPEQVILIELLFEPLGDTLLACCHSRKAGGPGWNEL